MAYRIKLRRDSAANWTSTNPTLSIAELGVETDTNQYKISNNGSTAWNSLGYFGTTGPAQTQPFRSFGDGSDGDVTISSGVTTLTRDAFYNSLTISGTGQLNAAHYKIYVKGVLNLNNAPAAAIINNGSNGNSASGTVAGTTLTVPVQGTLGTGGNGSGGGTGSTGAGANGTAGGSSVPSSIGNGGTQNTAGAGGAGSNAAGAGAAGGALTAFDVRRWENNLLRGISLIGGGTGAGGGGSGGGDSTNNGGGGGGGAQGGGVVAIYANIISKSSSTASLAIQAIGGNGGDGGDSDAAGIVGGGGGGAGGAGGWIYIVYNYLAGPVIKNMLAVDSGSGGKGGNGFGFVDGAATGKGGAGGGACNAGKITLFQVPMGTGKSLLANQIIGSGENPELNGSPAMGVTGGNGGMPQLFRFDL